MAGAGQGTPTGSCSLLSISRYVPSTLTTVGTWRAMTASKERRRREDDEPERIARIVRARYVRAYGDDTPVDVGGRSSTRAFKRVNPAPSSRYIPSTLTARWAESTTGNRERDRVALIPSFRYVPSTMMTSDIWHGRRRRKNAEHRCAKHLTNLCPSLESTGPTSTHRGDNVSRAGH